MVGNEERKSTLGGRPHAGQARRGREVVKFNAVVHGLRASSLLLPNESRVSFGKLAARLHRELTPVGALECLLVDAIVAVTWRLRRLEAAEVGLFIHYAERRHNGGDERPATQLGLAFVIDRTDAFSKLNRYRVSAERQLFRALRELRECQAGRRSSGQTGEAVAGRPASLS